MLDVVNEVEPEPLAVLRCVGQAGLDRIGDAGGVDLLTLDEDLPGDLGAPRATEDAHGEFGTAGTHEACDADDLTSAHREVGLVDNDTGRVLRVVDRPVDQTEDLVAHGWSCLLYTSR